MSLVVSMVGYQPSAVAVALRTWLRARAGPHHVVLLATPGTEAVAGRLRGWAEAGGVTCEVRPIADALTSEAGRPAVTEAVRTLALAPDGSPPVFLADAGLKFLAVAAVQALPAGSRVGHTDSERLHVHAPDDTWRALPLDDLGLDALLALYDVKADLATPAPQAGLGAALRAAGAVPLPVHIRTIRFREGDAGMLDLAYEARGQLFGLVHLEGPGRVDDVRALMRMANVLKGLRPRVALLADSGSALERARMEGHLLPIDARSRAGLERLARWVRGEVPPPGRPRRASAEPPPPVHVRLRRPPPYGPRLAVCVGDDPAATLVSVATHRPAVATFMYDAGTPSVVENARRLAGCVERLGLAEAWFVPSDHLGRGLAAYFGGREHTVCVDTSPGTKAQGCALARVPGLSLWSQDARSGWARPLDGGAQAVPLAAPATDVCALVNGGELLSPGRPLVDAQAEFFRLLGAFALCLTRRGGGQKLAGLRSRRCGCAHGRLDVVPSASRNSLVTVAHDGRAARASLFTGGGYWFEPLVGHAFRAAGCEDVRVGVRWRWPPELEARLRERFEDGRVPHRNDVDVLARWRHWYVIVECKVGPAQPLERVRRRIEAVTLVGVGRLGLPVVVRPQLGAAEVAQSLEARRGAVLLNLATVCDPEALAEALDHAFHQRSTRQS